VAGALGERHALLGEREAAGEGVAVADDGDLAVEVEELRQRVRVGERLRPARGPRAAARAASACG
jgi:hypothetical protein